MSGDSSILTLLRLGLSLAIVLGLIWCAAWVVRRRNGAGGPGGFALGGRSDRGPGIEVIERRSVGRHGAVAVVRVGEKSLLVGITEQQVQLLGEVDLDVDGPDPGAGKSKPVVTTTTVSSVDLTELRGTVKATEPVDVTDSVTRRIGSRGIDVSRSPRMNLMDALRELTVRRT